VSKKNSSWLDVRPLEGRKRDVERSKGREIRHIISHGVGKKDGRKEGEQGKVLLYIPQGREGALKVLCIS